MNTTKPQWIIKADEPFQGHVQSQILGDGTVAYSETLKYVNGNPVITHGRLTVNQYRAERDYPIRVIDDADLDALIAEYEASCITAPTKIDMDRYWEMLEVLPPCRWSSRAGIHFFHVSERLTGHLVGWFACIGSEMDESSQFFEWVDKDNAPLPELAEKVRSALTD